MTAWGRVKALEVEGSGANDALARLVRGRCQICEFAGSGAEDALARLLRGRCQKDPLGDCGLIETRLGLIEPRQGLLETACGLLETVQGFESNTLHWCTRRNLF